MMTVEEGTIQKNALPQPVLKWAGGKRQLLPSLLRLLPEKFGAYHEPFVGGGALFFALWRAALIRSGSTLSDSNEELIHFYSTLRDPGKLEAVIRMKDSSTYRYEESLYYSHRGDDPKKLTPVARAMRFLYLNRTCFNGIYRVNKEGKFNVPFGRYTNPTIVDEESLRAAARALSSVTVFCEDFAHYRAKTSDLVYFDPPYVPLSETADFTSYAKEGFTKNDQERLAEHFRKLASDGVFCLLSNSDTEFVRDLYAGFDIETVSAKRHVNSNAKKRGPVNEVIVRSWVKS